MGGPIEHIPDANDRPKVNSQGGLDLGDFEILLDDRRVEQMATRLRSKFGHARLADVVWVTFIQPAKEAPFERPDGVVVPSWMPEVAVFAAIGKDPRPWKRATDFIMSTASMDLAAFRQLESEHGHFVSGTSDAAWAPFVGATAELLHKLQSASEQILDVPLRS